MYDLLKTLGYILFQFYKCSFQRQYVFELLLYCQLKENGANGSLGQCVAQPVGLEQRLEHASVIALRQDMVENARVTGRRQLLVQ